MAVAKRWYQLKVRRDHAREKSVRKKSRKLSSLRSDMMVTEFGNPMGSPISPLLGKLFIYSMVEFRFTDQYLDISLWSYNSLTQMMFKNRKQGVNLMKAFYASDILICWFLEKLIDNRSQHCENILNVWLVPCANQPNWYDMFQNLKPHIYSISFTCFRSKISVDMWDKLPKCPAPLTWHWRHMEH